MLLKNLKPSGEPFELHPFTDYGIPTQLEKGVDCVGDTEFVDSRHEPFVVGLELIPLID